MVLPNSAINNLERKEATLNWCQTFSLPRIFSGSRPRSKPATFFSSGDFFFADCDLSVGNGLEPFLFRSSLPVALKNISFFFKWKDSDRNQNQRFCQPFAVWQSKDEHLLGTSNSSTNAFSTMVDRQWWKWQWQWLERKKIWFRKCSCHTIICWKLNLPFFFSASFFKRASSKAWIKSGQSRFSSGSQVLSSEL